MKTKEILSRFRAWYNQPVVYSDENLEEHRCANCGHVFKGNYCPVCRQAAGDGRITWKSVWKNIVNVWGLDTRSLPNTLWQLIVRPGHHIGNYISGHRQMSYSPANMLFIVAVFYVGIIHLFGGHTVVTPSSEIGDNEPVKLFFSILTWTIEHPGWVTMGLTLIMILPTWFLFRFSPRHTQHTLPEGVFIQLFMSTLMLLISLSIGISNGWTIFLVPFYYFFCYRQLFGYRFWGTVWRTALCFIVWAIVVIVISVIVIYVTATLILKLPDEMGLKNIVIIIVSQIIMVVAIIVIGYRISKRTSRQRKENTENP